MRRVHNVFTQMTKNSWSSVCKEATNNEKKKFARMLVYSLYREKIIYGVRKNLDDDEHTHNPKLKIVIEDNISEKDTLLPLLLLRTSWYVGNDSDNCLYLYEQRTHMVGQVFSSRCDDWHYGKGCALHGVK